MVVSILIIYPCDLRLTGSCRMLPLSSTVREAIPHMGSSGKDQNSKFQVQFLLNAYFVHTIIKSKNQSMISEIWSVFFIIFLRSFLKSKLHGQKLGKNINMLLSLLFSFTIRLFYILIHTTVQDV